MRVRSLGQPIALDEQSLTRFTQDAESMLNKVTERARDRNFGEAGIHGENRPPSLNQLSGSSKRSVQKALQEGRHVTPPVFRDLLKNAKLPPEQVLVYVQVYTQALMARNFASCLSILREALTIGDGDSPGVDWYYEGSITTTIRAFSFVHSEDQAGVAEDLSAAQELMAQSNEFGWITDVRPGFQVTAPSQPICELLGIPSGIFDGCYLLGDPLLSTLQEMLTNFGEWLLIIGMLTNTSMERWARYDTDSPYMDRVQEFFVWLRRYVTDHRDSIAEQIALAPVRIVDGRRSRDDLYQCLDAGMGRSAWPPYSPTRWNTMRMHIGKHPLLPKGKIARFHKVAHPIPNARNPIAFEISWNEEYADETANTLRREILRRLGLI